MIEIIGNASEELRACYEKEYTSSWKREFNLLQKKFPNMLGFESSWLQQVNLSNETQQWHQDQVGSSFGDNPDIVLCTWPRPTHYLLPATGISEKSFKEWWNEASFTEPHKVKLLDNYVNSGLIHGIAKLFVPEPGSVVRMSLDTPHKGNPGNVHELKHLVVRYVV